MLSKTLELDCFTCHPIFDIPGGDVARFADPNVFKQLSESHSEATSCAKQVSLVNLADIDLE